ncbi:UNVERIFIED_CONTAM: hypothetical protein NCL1_43387 [Trichonephila clavipes]
MACDAAECGIQMLNDDALRFPCTKNPTLSTMKWMKARTTTTTKVARVHQMLKRCLRKSQLWTGMNNNQSAATQLLLLKRIRDLAVK